MGVFVKTAENGWMDLEAGATPDELPGIGGWADIVRSLVRVRSTSTADGLDWSAWEFTGDGSLHRR